MDKTTTIKFSNIKEKQILLSGYFFTNKKEVYHYITKIKILKQDFLKHNQTISE